MITLSVRSCVCTKISRSSTIAVCQRIGRASTGIVVAPGFERWVALADQLHSVGIHLGGQHGGRNLLARSDLITSARRCTGGVRMIQPRCAARGPCTVRPCASGLRMPAESLQRPRDLQLDVALHRSAQLRVQSKGRIRLADAVEDVGGRRTRRNAERVEAPGVLEVRESCRQIACPQELIGVVQQELRVIRMDPVREVVVPRRLFAVTRCEGSAAECPLCPVRFRMILNERPMHSLCRIPDRCADEAARQQKGTYDADTERRCSLCRSGGRALSRADDMNYSCRGDQSKSY